MDVGGYIKGAEPTFYRVEIVTLLNNIEFILYFLQLI